ncbi:DEAD/DEAH box helicase family protein, partial [Streptomyces yangpuensis]|uniref:DEAD/DEAH box helicase family protein n=1 Tax=Streptomyces yangpuensis TaxID=1648182 RepID=UPI00402A8ECD
GLRATVISACGTGKTFIAAAAALRLARHGRVLVLLPTLDLLTQTVREWRLAGHTGPAVAVCSLEDDPQLWQLDVRTTTTASSSYFFYSLSFPYPFLPLPYSLSLINSSSPSFSNFHPLPTNPL